eukprot:5026318-Ditylum_brightwellii.AAC.1
MTPCSSHSALPRFITGPNGSRTQGAIPTHKKRLSNFTLLHETWLSVDTLSQIKFSKDSKSAMCIFFHHGQPLHKGRGSGGVGILLGPKGKTAWQLTGSPEP